MRKLWTVASLFLTGCVFVPLFGSSPPLLVFSSPAGDMRSPDTGFATPTTNCILEINRQYDSNSPFKPTWDEMFDW